MSVRVLQLTPKSKKQTQEDLLVAKLEKFYNQDDLACFKALVALILRTKNDDKSKVEFHDEESESKLREFVKDEYTVAIRVIDHFVVNYSKKQKVSYPVYSGKNGAGDDKYKIFAVNKSYKSYLKSFKKEFFDPFCRSTPINLVGPFGNSIHTTVGQLNFFRWCIPNLVLKYIQDNEDDIRSDMPRTANKRRRKPISKPEKTTMRIQTEKVPDKMEFIVSFE